jgi:hypothetical protein
MILVPEEAGTMIRRLAFLLGVIIASSTATHAQLPLPIPLPLPTGTPEDRAACEPDVQRFCKAAIPDTFRVLNCLQANRRQISNACQAVLTKYGQ